MAEISTLFPENLLMGLKVTFTCVDFRLYDKLQESENASAAYIEYVTDNECNQAGDKSEVSQAYKYLANYYNQRNQVDEAYKYAHKCLDYEEVIVVLFFFLST